MTCANFEIALCDYLDGTLGAAEKAEVERHLAECAAVRGTGPRRRRRSELHGACGGCGTAAGAGDASVRHSLRCPKRGLRVRRGIRGWFRQCSCSPVLQPRMVMGLSLTILFFGMMARCAGIPGRQLSRGRSRSGARLGGRGRPGATRLGTLGEVLRESAVCVSDPVTAAGVAGAAGAGCKRGPPAATTDERRFRCTARQQKDPGQPGKGTDASKTGTK